MKPDYSARKRGMPTMSIEERLKSNMKVNPVSGCWEWTGCKRITDDLVIIPAEEGE